jgi:hypothetical protein
LFSYYLNNLSICKLQADNFTFRNNTFANHVDENGEEFLGVPVKITTCLNVTFEGNKFSVLAGDDKSKIFHIEDSTNIVCDGEVIC